GTISAQTAGSKIIISSGGGVIATSDSIGTALLNGSGTLDLSGGNSTFNVADGAQAIDLMISTVIANGGVTTSGSGVMQLTSNNTYTGVTTVSAGRLQVDGPMGQIGNVSLAGGTLGGTGTVGAVTAAASGGTVSPGDSPGILSTGTATLNSAT